MVAVGRRVVLAADGLRADLVGQAGLVDLAAVGLRVDLVVPAGLVAAVDR